MKIFCKTPVSLNLVWVTKVLSIEINEITVGRSQVQELPICSLQAFERRMFVPLRGLEFWFHRPF